MAQTATDLTEKFLRALTELGATPEGRFLIAVSGGVDSMVLLDLSHRAGLNVGAAHVNYHLRGADSDADAQWVADYCKTRAIPCFVRDIPVAKHQRGHGVQTKARKARYAWFQELMDEMDFDFLLTAHHADDRLETFFINLIRGGGVRGLKSIPARRDNILRPLLDFSKEVLIDHARTHNVPWREDHTNQEDTYLRNKLRHHLIPDFLEYGPQVKTNLLKSVDFLGEAHAYFEREANTYIASIPWKGGVGKICDTRWEYLFNHPPLPMYVFAKWGFGPEMLPEIKRLAEAQSGKKILGKGGIIYRDRGGFLISQTLPTPPESVSIRAERGEVFQPVHLRWELVPKPENLRETPPGQAFLDADTLKWPLTLRPWRRGDKFKPLGMNGFKKISDFLVDEKIPLPNKDSVHVLEGTNGICWVIGHRIDARFALSPNTDNVIHFSVEKD